MSRLKKLIEQLCPDGVEYKPLSSIASFGGGKTPSKKDPTNYEEDGHNWVTSKDVKTTVIYKTGVTISDKGARGMSLYPAGAIVMVTRSGILQKYLPIAMLGEKSTVNQDIKVILASNEVLSKYLLYALQARAVSMLSKYHKAGTVDSVDFDRIKEDAIPVPPIEVQREIVRILDSMQELDDALSEEIVARKSQLAENVDNLMNSVIERKPLSDCGILEKGKGLQKSDFSETGVGCIHYGQIYTRLGSVATKTLTFVDAEKAKKFTVVHPGDLVITVTSETTEDVCKSVAWMGDGDIVTGAHASVFRHSMNPVFASYLMQTSDFIRQKVMFAFGVKVIEMKNDDLGKIVVPCPSIDVQNEIADKLSAMQDLIENIEQELRARRKQFEYYRDKLLDFPEKVA